MPADVKRPNNRALWEASERRLDTIEDAAMSEGFRPEVLAALVGMTRGEAIKAARRHDRPAAVKALSMPTGAEKRAARIEDIEWLLDVGTFPDSAAQRTGFVTVDNAVDRLALWGRPDLSKRLSQAAYQDRWRWDPHEGHEAA